MNARKLCLLVLLVAMLSVGYMPRASAQVVVWPGWCASPYYSWDGYACWYRRGGFRYRYYEPYGYYHGGHGYYHGGGYRGNGYDHGGGYRDDGHRGGGRH